MIVRIACYAMAKTFTEAWPAVASAASMVYSYTLGGTCIMVQAAVANAYMQFR